jgi:hypothetical protein
MYSRKIIFSMCILISSYVNCDEISAVNSTVIEEKESNVLILNSSNFNETLESYEFVFVNFCEYPVDLGFFLEALKNVHIFCRSRKMSV